MDSNIRDSRSHDLGSGQAQHQDSGDLTGGPNNITITLPFDVSTEEVRRSLLAQGYLIYSASQVDKERAQADSTIKILSKFMAKLNKFLTNNHAENICPSSLRELQELAKELEVPCIEFQRTLTSFGNLTSEPGRVSTNISGCHSCAPLSNNTVVEDMQRRLAAMEDKILNLKSNEKIKLQYQGEINRLMELNRELQEKCIRGKPLAVVSPFRATETPFSAEVIRTGDSGSQPGPSNQDNGSQPGPSNQVVHDNMNTSARTDFERNDLSDYNLC